MCFASIILLQIAGGGLPDQKQGNTMEQKQTETAKDIDLTI